MEEVSKELIYIFVAMAKSKSYSLSFLIHITRSETPVVALQILILIVTKQ